MVRGGQIVFFSGVVNFRFDSFWRLTSFCFFTSSRTTMSCRMWADSSLFDFEVKIGKNWQTGVCNGWRGRDKSEIALVPHEFSWAWTALSFKMTVRTTTVQFRRQYFIFAFGSLIGLTEKQIIDPNGRSQHSPEAFGHHTTFQGPLPPKSSGAYSERLCSSSFDGAVRIGEMTAIWKRWDQEVAGR
jgi:hypothetical protein